MPPYNPTLERTNNEQLVAAHWECLRRNERFCKLARRWVRSAKFRAEYGVGNEYNHKAVHFHRCALDWMLTPEQRLQLAGRQIRASRLFPDERFNFGPIRIKWLLPKERWFGVPLEKIVEVTAQDAAQGQLDLMLDWSRCPSLFKKQFRFTILPAKRDVKQLNPSLRKAVPLLRSVASYLSGSRPGDRKWFASKIIELADQLREHAEFCMVFAVAKKIRIPKSFNDNVVAKIRATFQQDGFIESEAKYNRHGSYYGTAEEWKWFLRAEQRGFKNFYGLAGEYSKEWIAELKRKGELATADPKRIQISSANKRNRAGMLRGHVAKIRHWINRTFPPPK